MERYDAVEMGCKHSCKLSVLSGRKSGSVSLSDKFPLSRCLPMLSIYAKGTVWKAAVEAGVVCANLPACVSRRHLQERP